MPASSASGSTFVHYTIYYITNSPPAVIDAMISLFLDFTSSEYLVVVVDRYWSKLEIRTMDQDHDDNVVALEGCLPEEVSHAGGVPQDGTTVADLRTSRVTDVGCVVVEGEDIQ